MQHKIDQVNVVSLISFGLGGHGELTCNGKRSGYESPDTWRPDPSVAYIWGCPVIDKRARLKEFPGLAIAAPIPDARLCDGAVERCGDPSDSMVGAAVMADPGNAFGVLAKAQVAARRRGAEPGPLDSVSVADYVRWWRMRGARVGRVVDCVIQWEPLPGELAAATPAPEQSELF